jgi:hypothetical protein
MVVLLSPQCVLIPCTPTNSDLLLVLTLLMYTAQSQTYTLVQAMTAAASQAVMQCCIGHQFWAQAAAVVQDMLHSRNQQLQPDVLRIAILGCCRGQGLNEAYTLLQQLKVSII